MWAGRGCSRRRRAGTRATFVFRWHYAAGTIYAFLLHQTSPTNFEWWCGDAIRNSVLQSLASLRQSGLGRTLQAAASVEMRVLAVVTRCRV